MSKRRFRIRTKHYEFMMVALLAAGFGFVGHAFYQNSLNAKAAKQAQLASVSAAKSAPQKLNPAQLRALQIRKQVVGYMAHIRQALGNDKPGQLAFLIFMRSLAEKRGKLAPKVMSLCVSDKSCPIKVTALYGTAFSRLNPATDGLAKLALQKELIKTQLSSKTKISILMNAILSQKNKGRAVASTVMKDGKVKLSAITEYQVLTLAQIEELKLPDKQFISIAFKVAQHLNDPVGSKMVLQSLRKGYPKYSRNINSEAHHMGVTLASR